MTSVRRVTVLLELAVALLIVLPAAAASATSRALSVGVQSPARTLVRLHSWFRSIASGSASAAPTSARAERRP